MSVMKPQNEAQVLILSLVVTVGLLGIGIWWFMNREQTVEKLPTALKERISFGDKILVNADTNEDKKAGVQAFKSKDFDRAIASLKKSQALNRNDPETLIYLNNVFAAQQASVANKQVVKIATSVPIGSNLNVTKEILRGVAQAQDEVNRSGGINGALLQVAIANDENDTALVKKIAAFFVQDTSLLAVVGHNSSDASIAAAPVYEQGKLVMISATSTSQQLSGAGEYIFRTVPTVRSVADTLASFAIKSDRKTNLAVCFDSLASDSKSFRDEFIATTLASGAKFINIGCNFSAPAFNPDTVISQAVSAGADGLLLAPHVDRIELAIKLARANKQRLTLFGSSTMYTFKTLQSGQADVNGLVLAAAWHPAAIPDNPFPSNAAKLWGGKVNWRTAMAYDATGAIIAGLRQNNTRDGLQKALSNPAFSANGATGKIEFLPSGDRNGAAILIKVQPGNLSGTGYDFVPIKP